MDVTFLIDVDACQTAAAILRARTARNLDALATLERQHQQNLVDFIRGTLTDADLDQHTAERQRLEALSREDHTLVLEAISKRRDQLLKDDAQKRRAQEMHEQRLAFMARYNQILMGTEGFTLDDIKRLKEIAPGDVEPAEFYRFEFHRSEYSSSSAANRVPYKDFARISLYEMKD